MKASTGEKAVAVPRVTIVCGDDTVGRERGRDQLLRRIRESYPSILEERFDPSRETFLVFAERMLTPSLFASMRLFLVRHADDLSEKEQTLLVESMAMDLPDVILLIEIDPPSRTSKRAENALKRLSVGKNAKSGRPAINLIQCAKPPDYKLAQWLTVQAPLFFGRDIGKQAAEYLIELVGTDLDAIHSELLKIDINLPAGAPVDKTAIDSVTGASRAMDSRELARALGVKDMGRSLEIIDALFVANVSLPGAVGTMFRHFWALFRLRAFGERNRDLMKQYRDSRTPYQKKNEIAHGLGVAAGLLAADDPVNKAYPAVILSGIVEQARGFSSAQLKRIIRLLQAFDADVKAGRVEQSKGNFQDLCYRIARASEIEPEAAG
jgi:DNA polymerase III delta subunit